MSTRVADPGAILCRTFGGIVAYGCFSAFLVLVSVQVYRWLRDGEWTHIGITDGLRAVVAGCCVKAGDAGLFATLVHWLDTPTNWLGWHKVLEVVPASIGLFVISIIANWACVYGSDRMEEQTKVAEQTKMPEPMKIAEQTPDP